MFRSKDDVCRARGESHLGRRNLIILAAGLMLAVFILSMYAADRTWRETDFNALAIKLVGSELPAAEQIGLKARTLHMPSGKQDRFICIQPDSAMSHEVYEVQFRKGLFGVNTNEIYTPSFKSGQTRAIVRDDCLPTAAN